MSTEQARKIPEHELRIALLLQALANVMPWQQLDELLQQTFHGVVMVSWERFSTRELEWARRIGLLNSQDALAAIDHEKMIDLSVAADSREKLAFANTALLDRRELLRRFLDATNALAKGTGALLDEIEAQYPELRRRQTTKPDCC